MWTKGKRGDYEGWEGSENAQARELLKMDGLVTRMLRVLVQGLEGMAFIMLEKAEMIVMELVVMDVRQLAKLKATI